MVDDSKVAHRSGDSLRRESERAQEPEVAVLDLGVGTTWTGHCTGTKAFQVLRGTMGDRVRELHTGSRLEL